MINKKRRDFDNENVQLVFFLEMSIGAWNYGSLEPVQRDWTKIGDVIKAGKIGWKYGQEFNKWHSKQDWTVPRRGSDMPRYARQKTSGGNFFVFLK